MDDAPAAELPRVHIGFTETKPKEHRVDLGDWSEGQPWPKPPCGAYIMAVLPDAFDPASPSACAHCARADQRAT